MASFFKMVHKTIPCQTTLAKVAKMMSPKRTITFPYIPDKVFVPGPTFPKMVPKQSLVKTIFVKVLGLMTPIRPITFPHIPDKVFSLASLFQNGPQDNSSPNHVKAKLENDAP